MILKKGRERPSIYSLLARPTNTPAAHTAKVVTKSNNFPNILVFLGVKDAAGALLDGHVED